MPRYALLLAYDGTGFAGWWRQPGRATIAGELDAACARIAEPEAEAVGASRTDAGVHALGQLAHLDLRRTWEPARLLAALNRQLPPAIVVRAAAAVAPDWHAVHGVRRKTYRYAIDGGALRDPFRVRTAWRMPGLDAGVLAAAAAHVPGRRDWAAFVRRGEYRTSTVCRVSACRWRMRDGLLACDLTADAFIYRLVRSLVGGMALVARGGCGLAAWRAVLDGAAGEAARQQAPAHGLTLLRVAHRAPPAWVTPSG
jgi:tRNA pseudouridine38-40 synthase